ncbi:hypothetical protein [Streptomyces sp. NPDC087859]
MTLVTEAYRGGSVTEPGDGGGEVSGVQPGGVAQSTALDPTPQR